MPCYKVQTTCEAALETFGTGTANGHIEKLAKSCGQGRWHSNAERDLNNFTKPAVTLELYFVKLPIKIRVTRKGKRFITSTCTIWELIPFILPWSVMRLLYRTDLWHLAHASEAMTEDFWTDFRLQSYSVGHSIPETCNIVPAGRTTPLHFHMDRTQIVKGSGYGSENIVYSWSGTLTRG